MPNSKSTSDSSSSSDSVEEKPSVTLDHSETSTEAEQAPAKARAYAGMFTFPCPRHYCQDLAGRQACKVLKPSDVSKEQLMEDFRKALKIKGYLHNLIKMGVADGPQASQALSCRCPRTSQALDLSVSDTHGARWSAADVGREVWLPLLFYIPSHGVGCLPGLFYPSSYTREKAEAELAQVSAQAAG